jgi:hypothetical protein
MRGRLPWSQGLRSLAVGLALVPAPALLAVEAPSSDDEFIAALGNEADTTPVDRKRLARLFFSLAAALESGKSSVQLLHGKIAAPESSRQAVNSLLRSRFEDYSRSLGRYKNSVTELLDEPASRLLLYETLNEGHRVCWHLDLHNRLVEAYGAEADLLSTLSSREACNRLRTAAFQPRVEALVRDALVEHIYQREEILDLRTDLRALEDLLADLRRIEEGPP